MVLLELHNNNSLDWPHLNFIFLKRKILEFYLMKKLSQLEKDFRAHYLRPVLHEKWAENYIFLLLVINNKLTLNTVSGWKKEKS